MKPLRHQAKVLLAFMRSWSMVCLVGGLGSAKTITQYLASMLRAQQTPGGRQLLMLPTSGMIEDVAYPAFDDWLNRQGIPHRWRKPEGRRNLYVHVAGRWAEIRFRSGERPDRLDGGEYCHLGADEAGQLSDAAIKKLFARGRGYKRITKLLTGTPEGQHGRFYDEAEVNRDPSTLVVRARTDDNPYLEPSPEEYIRELCKGYSPEELEAYRNGFFVPPQGRAYWAWQDARNVQRFDFRLVTEHVMGCDFNVTPMHWVLAATWQSGGERFIHIHTELTRDNTNTWAHSELAADTWADLLAIPHHHPTREAAAARVTAYSDAAGRARSTKAAENDFAAMRKVGFKVRDARKNPPVRDRVFAVNTVLRDGRLLIDPSCAETIRCLSSQGRDKWGEPDKTQGHDHATDAVGYLVWGLAPSVAPKGNARGFGWR
jgi:hypothetical protein